MNRKKVYKVFFLVEILILIVLGFLFVIRRRTNQDIDITIMDWKSDYIAYDSMYGWYVDEKLVQTGEKIDIVCGPNISLDKGTYSAKIMYYCDYDQSCVALSDGSPDFQLKTGEVELSRNFDYLSYDFEVKEDIEDFELRFRYDGQGFFQVTNVVIAQNAKGLLRDISIVLAFFIFIDLCLLFADKIKKNRNTILALAGIALLSSVPLFTDGIAGGHDLPVHLMRIEGLANEIRLGNIPVRISSSYIDGFGYPISIYYGDLLLYLPALLRLLGFSVTNAYKFYVLMVNVGTVVISYFCMKHVFKKKEIALLTSLAYCTSTYRLVNIYERAAVGEYSAMMFMPVVAAAAYKIYTDDISDDKGYSKNALLLALGMSGLIGTHILSTEMTVFVLIVVCVSLLKLTCRKNTLKVYLLAVVGTVVLSAYFIVPFLDYSINVPSKIGAIINKGGMDIQKWGITLSEYFSFFRNIHMQSQGLEAENGRMLLTPGMILMMALLAAVVFWVNHRGDKIMKALTVYACLAIAVTLNVFPWDYLQSHFWVGNLLAQVQFPWRYVGIAMIVLTLLLGNLLTQISEEPLNLTQCGKAIVIVGFVMTCVLTSSYLDNGSFTDSYDGAELDDYQIGTGEYLRDGTNRLGFSSISSEVKWERMSEVSVLSRRGSSMELHCVGTDEEGVVWLPMFNYKGYHATDGNGKEYPISDGYDNRIELSLPAGFDDNIFIEYREPWYWKVAGAVSLLAVLAILYSYTKPYFCKKQFSDNGGD